MPLASLSLLQGLTLMFGWKRLLVAFGTTLLIASMLSSGWTPPISGLILRSMAISLFVLFAFGLFEQWPKRLPGWIARWVLQVIAVAAAVPFAVLVISVYTTDAGSREFWRDERRIAGLAALIAGGLLIAPWVAVTALLRQRDYAARTFELQRSELQRTALDARLRLLQAQVEPHFLFNTLANVRELVESGSAQAVGVLDSLIAYLRAAVPRLHEPSATMAREIELVRAYLELMHMRMPDRLQFNLDIDQAALPLRCPPMSLLTLVENAVRHGIDPGERGGRIDVQVRLRDGRCMARVIDTGVGLRVGCAGLGTGLNTLRERLQLVFEGDARLQISATEPHGVSAEIEFPERRDQP